MNIAYIVPSLANRGPVIVVKDLVSQMVRHSHNCEVYYFDDKPSPIGFDCPTRRIGPNETIDFTCFDIVHSHGMRPDRYVAKYREYSGATRYISTVHNYVFEDFRYQYNWLVAQTYGRKWIYTLQKFDTIVALSDHARHYYLRWFPPAKTTFAYNTRILDPQAILATSWRDELLAFKKDATLIGTNALLTRRKGIDLLINALPSLPTCKLFIVGEGKERSRLEQQAKRQGVADRCFFAGYRQNASLYLPFYDIYALPSRSEGFPLSLLEAACYGKICVASNLPIIQECFTGEQIAIFELNKPITLVEAIEKAVADPQIGKRLQNKYLSDYSPEAMYERYIQIYYGTL